MMEDLEAMDDCSMLKDEPIQYLALGDSYTIGQGVETNQRWPVQLVNQLNENQIDVEAIRVIAKTGWTTENLIDATESVAVNQYNLVSLLIGVNNQFQRLSFEQFKSEFNLLVNRSIDLAGCAERVFVVSIPDYGVTPFGNANRLIIAEEIDNYNDFISSRCDELDIPFIDVTIISRELGDATDALASDRLHPSALQYAAWVEEIFPIVVSMLN
jgi:lysophospholipase L1-like esterase